MPIALPKALVIQSPEVKDVRFERVIPGHRGVHGRRCDRVSVAVSAVPAYALVASASGQRQARAQERARQRGGSSHRRRLLVSGLPPHGGLVLRRGRQHRGHRDRTHGGLARDRLRGREQSGLDVRIAARHPRPPSRRRAEAERRGPQGRHDRSRRRGAGRPGKIETSILGTAETERPRRPREAAPPASRRT